MTGNSDKTLSVETLQLNMLMKQMKAFRAFNKRRFTKSFLQANVSVIITAKNMSVVL